MPYDYIEEYQKQDDETIWLFRDKDAQKKIDIDAMEIQGNPINFTTLSAQNAKSTILSVEPIQDLHGYDKPWVGGAGKNILSDIENGAWDTDTQTKIAVATRARSKEVISVTQLTSYTLSATVTGGKTLNGVIVQYDSNNTVVDDSGWKNIPYTFSTVNNCTKITLMFKTADNANNPESYASNAQLEQGTTATSYEPYENLCPISGRTKIGILGVGKNILHIDDGSYASGSVIVSNGLIKINGTFNSQTVNLANYVNRAELNKYIGKQLTFSKTDIKGNLEYNAPFFPGIGDWNYWHLNSNNKNTIIHNRKIDAFILYLNGTYDVEFYLQVEVNDDASEYEPYQESNNLSIDLPSTVYGGVLDLESGILTVTHNRIAITSDISISKNSDGWNAYHPSYYFFFSPSGIIDRSNITCISNIMVGVTRGQIQNTNLIYACNVAGGGNEIDFTSDLDNTTDVKQFLIDNNAEFVYKLATPITIQLTPHQISLLEGVNNISTTADGIKLTYRNGVFATLEDLTFKVDKETGKGLSSNDYTDSDKAKVDTIEYKFGIENGIPYIEEL